MNSSYKIVMRLELLHEYYIEAIAKHLTIVPSLYTQELVRNYDIKWKQSGNWLFLAAKTDGTGKTLKQWPADLKLVFYILSGNSLFHNITNPSYLPSSATTNWLCNFSANEFTEPASGGGTVNRLHLSMPISTHVAATIYQTGKLVTDQLTDDVYECLKTTMSGTLLSNTGFWRKRGKKQYVTANDSATLATAVLPFRVSTAATVFTANFFGLNVNTGTYNVEARAPEVQKIPSASTAINVSLKGLTAGRYRIEVNGESKFIVVKDASLLQTPVTVIELYNHVGTAASFSLLNAGVAADKRFTVRFCNKSVLWKYIAKSSDVTAVNDSSNTLSFSNALTPAEFLSTAPYPLNEQPLKTISFTSAIHGVINSLPNASPVLLSETEQDGEVYPCSSIYLNH